MSLIIDCHTHAFPDQVEKVLPNFSRGPLAKVRRQARNWFRPFAGTLHQSQTWVRILPPAMRRPIDQLAHLAPLPGLILESTPQDLRERMAENSVAYAWVIAHPPWVENDWLVSLTKENPRLIAFVNVTAATPKPGEELKRLFISGARGLKIHIDEGHEGPESEHELDLLRTARELGLPVILHLDDARKYSPWFKNFPEVRFILAHMGLHEPGVAMDLAEEFPNLFVDTSWQPPESIGEAVRRLGSRRVLFGSDWPLLGNNIAVGISRIRDCVDTGMINDEQAARLLGENAAKMMGITVAT